MTIELSTAAIVTGLAGGVFSLLLALGSRAIKANDKAIATAHARVKACETKLSEYDKRLAVAESRLHDLRSAHSRDLPPGGHSQ